MPRIIKTPIDVFAGEYHHIVELPKSRYSIHFKNIFIFFTEASISGHLL
jgi:hypothetical protein